MDYSIGIYAVIVLIQWLAFTARRASNIPLLTHSCTINHCMLWFWDIIPVTLQYNFKDRHSLSSRYVSLNGYYTIKKKEKIFSLILWKLTMGSSVWVICFVA